jgi:hypothetical protein
MKLRIFVIKHKRYGMMSTMVGYNEEDAFNLSRKSPEEWEVVWKNEEE